MQEAWSGFQHFSFYSSSAKACNVLQKEEGKKNENKHTPLSRGVSLEHFVFGLVTGTLNCGPQHLFTGMAQPSG